MSTGATPAFADATILLTSVPDVAPSFVIEPEAVPSFLATFSAQLQPVVSALPPSAPSSAAATALGSVNASAFAQLGHDEVASMLAAVAPYESTPPSWRYLFADNVQGYVVDISQTAVLSRVTFNAVPVDGVGSLRPAFATTQLSTAGGVLTGLAAVDGHTTQFTAAAIGPGLAEAACSLATLLVGEVVIQTGGLAFPVAMGIRLAAWAAGISGCGFPFGETVQRRTLIDRIQNSCGPAGCTTVAVNTTGYPIATGSTTPPLQYVPAATAVGTDVEYTNMQQLSNIDVLTLHKYTFGTEVYGFDWRGNSSYVDYPTYQQTLVCTSTAAIYVMDTNWSDGIYVSTTQSTYKEPNASGHC